MTSIFVILLLGVGAFFVGGIPFGLIIARLLAHEDIRSEKCRKYGGCAHACM